MTADGDARGDAPPRQQDGQVTDGNTGQPLLAVQDVARHFRSRQLTGHGFRSTLVRAVDGMSLSVGSGETVGIVGESGCGKSTLGRVILGLDSPTAGRVMLDGWDVATVRGKARQRLRRRVQAVFQDPYGSLDPRMKIGRALGEVVACHNPGWNKPEVTKRSEELLAMVGLDSAKAAAYPSELSGGQRQRVGIAKAFAAGPDLIVADEPVSALDVSAQAQVINLMVDLQAKTGVAYLIIGHGLAAMEHICDRIAVMYLGKIVEIGASEAILSAPAHHYTAALIDSVLDLAPGPQRPLSLLRGEPASARAVPSGCRFRTRCAAAQPRCAEQEPPLTAIDAQHSVACFYPRPSAARGAEQAALDDQHAQTIEPRSPGKG
jgi:peptide/nickel transport system ATP-binding protein